MRSWKPPNNLNSFHHCLLFPLFDYSFLLFLKKSLLPFFLFFPSQISPPCLFLFSFLNTMHKSLSIFLQLFFFLIIFNFLQTNLYVVKDHHFFAIQLLHNFLLCWWFTQLFDIIVSIGAPPQLWTTRKWFGIQTGETWLHRSLFWFWFGVWIL